MYISKLRMSGVFGTGWAISFAGSLPGGTIALAIIQISALKGMTAGILFSLGDILVEIIFVRLLLSGLGWLDGRKQYLRVLNWVSAVVLFALAAGSIRSAFQPESAGTIFVDNGMHPFVFGVVLRSIIPTLIPYWLGICVMLLANGVLERKPSGYNRFALGIGLGTLTAHLIYVAGGSLARQWITDGQVYIQWALAILFLVLGVAQLRKGILNK